MAILCYYFSFSLHCYWRWSLNHYNVRMSGTWPTLLQMTCLIVVSNVINGRSHIYLGKKWIICTVCLVILQPPRLPSSVLGPEFRCLCTDGYNASLVPISMLGDLIMLSCFNVCILFVTFWIFVIHFDILHLLDNWPMCVQHNYL